MEAQRTSFGDEKPALIIMDNFKGQITSDINQLLEENDVHVALLPPNTTDRLQPMDISINKPAKDFLKHQFEEWYSLQISTQLTDEDNVETVELQPINLSLPVLKEKGAKWLVEMFDYIAANPQFIVNGFA